MHIPTNPTNPNSNPPVELNTLNKDMFPISTNPTVTLTPAQQQLKIMKAAFLTLPEPEQNEIQTVLERLRFLQAKYGSSAKLAIVATSIEIAVAEGQ